MKSEKKCLDKIKGFIKEHRCLIRIMIIVFIVSMAIYFGINEAYKVGKVYITLWGAADVLSFYGEYLSFIGTVVLGIVAYKQNQNANKVNEQMRKLQEAEFVSMVSINCLEINKRGANSPNYLNTNMQDIEVLDCTSGDMKSNYFYHIDVEFNNSSDYPIVQIDVHPGLRGNGNYQLYGMTKLTERSIYIPEKKTKAIRFIIPSAKFEYTKQYSLALCLKFTNIFDYTVNGAIYIDDLENAGKKNKYKYRLAKFTDVC